MNRLVLALCAGWLTSALVDAQSTPPPGGIGVSYNVDFGANATFPAPASSFGASSGQAGTWNAVSKSASFQFLDDVGGSPGGTITVTGGVDLIDLDAPNASTTGDQERLMDDALRFTTPVTVSLTGILFGKYSVIVYSWAPDAPAQQTAVEIVGGAHGPQSCGGAAGSPLQHGYGTTYVMETLDIPLGTLDIVLTPLAGVGTCNGIQLVAIADPTGNPLTNPAIDLSTLPGAPECTAVEFAWGDLLVAGVPTGGGSTLYRLDSATQGFLDSQPLTGVPHDLASKDIERKLFVTAGASVYTYTFDWNGNQTSCVYWPAPDLTGGAGAGDARAIAYDPLADQLWWYDAATERIAVGDTNWNVVASFPSAGKDWRGFGWDEPSGTLWGFARNSPTGSSTDRVEMHEINPQTGQLTGRSALGLTGLPADNLAGGIDVRAEPSSGTLAMWAVHVCNSPAGDRLVEYDLAAVFCDGDIDFYCTPGTSANGCTASLTSLGDPSASMASGFELRASGVDGLRTGLFFYGLSGASASTWGSSSSFLCVKAPTQRTQSQGSGGTFGACDGSYSLDWNAFVATHPSAVGAPFQGGETVWAQAWFRDPPTPKTTALSNAVRFVVCP